MMGAFLLLGLVGAVLIGSMMKSDNDKPSTPQAPVPAPLVQAPLPAPVPEPPPKLEVAAKPVEQTVNEKDTILNEADRQRDIKRRRQANTDQNLFNLESDNTPKQAYKSLLGE